MKKILSLVLAAVLLLTMPSTVFASSVKLTNTTTSADLGVEAIYQSGDDAQTICVDISWEGLNFTYTGATQVWDAAAHKYNPSTNGGWVANNAAITITNHSNVILQANLSFTPATGFDEIGMIFTSNAPYIGSAYTGSNGGSACAVTIPLIPIGDLPESTTTKTAIGAITVSVQTVNQTPQVIQGELAAWYLDLAEEKGVNRGDVYFKDLDAADAVEIALGEWNPDAEETVLNAALNNIITAFYSGLTIKQ